MPYYSGYSASGDTIYWILIIPILILSIWAQSSVSSKFKKYSAVRNMRGLTGADAAREVLRVNGVHNVPIQPCTGSLTDHYDPRNNTIYLSESVYSAPTVAAVGVASHEAGHAVQYAMGYAPVKLRTAIIPVTQFGSKFAFIALFAGLFLGSSALLLIGVLLFSAMTFFQLVTLPVEFNASNRALEAIEQSGILTSEEQEGARKVLRAAALTYVAALLASAAQLLRYVSIFLSSSGRRRR